MYLKDDITTYIEVVLLVIIWIALSGGLAAVAHFLLTLPMRRANGPDYF